MTFRNSGSYSGRAETAKFESKPLFQVTVVLSAAKDLARQQRTPLLA